MNSTSETPAEPPVKISRRARWIAGFTTIVVVVVVVATMAGSEEKPMAGARGGGGRKPGYSDHVREHTRMQAYGPQHSQRRQVRIDPYPRGPVRAA